jgi:hypothetical protein
MAKPQLSVVIPLVDGRGDELECVRSWTHRQTLDRREFQVVLASTGSDPAFDRAAASLLQSHDLFVEAAGTMHDLYQAGAAAAQGELLFFTELHCDGDPDCLRAGRDWFAGHPEMAGACLNVAHHNENEVGALEQAIFDDGWREWGQGDHWRRVFPRGFAIRRQVYDAVGGYEGYYGHFADIILSARLDRGGHRMGVIHDAWVTHHNTSTFDMLRFHATEFGVGQHRYALTCSAADEKYAGFPRGWHDALGDTRRRAGSELLRLAVTLFRNMVLHPTSLKDWAGQLGRIFGPRLATLVVGRGWRSWAAAFEIWRRQLRLAWVRDPKRQRDEFTAQWNALIARGLIREAVCERSYRGVAPGRIGVDAMPITAWQGVQGLEHENGQVFRWTEPVSRLRLSLPSPGEWELAVETHYAEPPRRRLLAVLLDGRRVPVIHEEHRFRVTLPIETTGHHDMLLVCTPYLPSRFGLSDHRALGLPIVAVECSLVAPREESRRTWQDAARSDRDSGHQWVIAGDVSEGIATSR